MLITLLVLFFSFQQRANSITAKTARTENTDIKLADLIKQDLRRNNDDYIDKFNNSKVEVALNKQRGADNVAKTNVKQQLGDSVSQQKLNKVIQEKHTNRRNIEFSDEIDYNKYSFSPVTVTSNPSAAAVPKINTKRYQKVKTANPASLASSNGRSIYVKKAKIDEFKQFIDKNKGLIQDFINNKKREEVEATEPMPALRADLEEADEDALRSKSSEERRGATPGPNQLDMSPAKGGRIHSMRLKGRLCQRNVLVPEGPKYDSKGREYLAAFSRARRESTPALVLPRCCNCCRKSVLGCQ